MSVRSIKVRLQAEVSDFNRQIQSSARSLSDFEKSAQKTGGVSNTALGRMAQSAQINRKEWDQVGSTMMRVGGVITAAVAGTVASAVKWESAWAGVLKTVDGTPEQLGRVEDGLRGLARELPASHQEIAAVAEAAGQLGIQTENVVGFTKVMIDLGETTNLSAEEAATSLARFSNIMGTSQSDVHRLGAALVGLGNNYATTESEILAMSMRLSGQGKQIGLSEGQVMGLAAAMSSVGIEAEAGGTAMSLTMKRIGRAVDEGGDHLNTFARVSGMSATDFQKAWRDDAGSALIAFIQGLENAGLQGESVTAILDDLGIKGIRESDAMLRLSANSELAFAAMQQGVEEYVDATALLEEANKRYETTESKIQIAKNAIVDAGIEMGATFLPAVAKVAEGVATLSASFGNLPSGIQASIGIFGALGGAALLAGGSMMLALPKWLSFREAVVTLSNAHPLLGKFDRALGSVSKVMLRGAAIGAGGLLIARGFDAIAGPAKTAALGVEEVTLALMQGDIEDIASRYEGSMRSVADAFDLLLGESFESKMERFGSGLNNMLGGHFSDQVNDARQLIEELDAGISNLANSGNVELAASQFEELVAAAELEGYTREQLLGIMPQYREALASTAIEQGNASESASGLADGIGEISPEVEEATKALEDWYMMAHEASAGFIDLLGGYQSVIDKNIEVAQATADATESSKDSWETYYDGVTVSMKDYLAALEEQVEAQRDWQINMLMLSGRVSEGLRDHLMEMGPMGAALVADLVDASDEELQRLEEVFGQAAGDATISFADNLLNAGPLFETIMSTSGEKAARAAAEAIASGEMSIQEAIDKYDLSAELTLDDSGAVTTFNQVTDNWERTKTDTRLDLDTKPADGVFGAATAGWDRSLTSTNLGLDSKDADRTFKQLTDNWERTSSDTKLAADTQSADKTFTRITDNWQRTTTKTALNLQDNLAQSQFKTSTTGWRNTTTNTQLGLNTSPASSNLTRFLSTIPSTRTIRINTIGGGSALYNDALFHGGVVRGLAAGGLVPGPRAGRDNVGWPLVSKGQLLTQPLEGGEFVVRSSQAAKYEPQLRAMNAGTYRPGLYEGGSVGGVSGGSQTVRVDLPEQVVARLEAAVARGSRSGTEVGAAAGLGAQVRGAVAFGGAL